MTTELQMSFSNTLAGPGKHVCPACQAGLMRVWRRPIDRFTGLFVSVRRYRCESFACGWEGNFRARRVSHHRHAPATAAALLAAARVVIQPTVVRPRALPRSLFVFTALALALAGLLFVVGFTTTDWLPASDGVAAELHDANWLASTRLSGPGTTVEIDSRASDAPSMAAKTAAAR